MNNRKIFTSESVTQGHPDKLCDLVSDSVLDAVLEQDPMGRVACETAATTGMVLVMGEITTSARIDIAQIARKAICDAGYDRPEMGFDGHSCNVMVSMGRQSPDIAMGVDNAYDDGTTGAGDQGMMFGFACTQTKELMPAPIAYAHNLTKALTHARESGLLPWLRPDGKSQVSVEYGPDGLPARIDTVVVSTQHADTIAIDDLRKAVIETVIEPNLPSRLLDENTKYYVNPTGRFVIGGRFGPHGPQDHRRHLRRLRGPRRRRVLRQGPHEGRPQRRVHGTLYRKKSGRSRSGRRLPAAAGLRHRRGAPCFRSRRDIWNRQDRG